MELTDIQVKNLISNILNEGKNYVNMDVDVREGGRHAVKMTVDEFKQEMIHAYHMYAMEQEKKYNFDLRLTPTPDSFVYSLCYKNRNNEKSKYAAKLYKDIWGGKYKFDSENVNAYGGIKMSKKGFPYLLCNAGGDWESPVCFFVYFDGNNFRGYVPLKGNAINRNNNTAFQGIGDEEEAKFIAKENGIDYEEAKGLTGDIGYNADACLEDFLSRVDVKGTYKKRDHTKDEETFKQYRKEKIANEKKRREEAERKRQMNTQENNGEPQLEPDNGDEINETVRNILNKFANPYILNESRLLLEADDRLKKVARTIEHEFNGLLDPTAPVRGSEYYVNNNPNTTWMDYLIFSLRHTFGLMTNQDVKYLPLVANLAFSDEVGFEKRNDNGAEIAQLQKIVSMLKTDDELFNSLNKVKDTVSFSQVCEQLKPQLQVIAQSDTDNAENVAVNNSYDIVEITSYGQAHEIGNHSCSSNRLCYTQSLDTWNSYTKNGINRPYVCLRNGWENIPEVAGEDNPYDEYGTSMIFVFIDPEGNIAFSNCRWNHKNVGPYMDGGDVDHAFTKTSLAQTVGRPFTSVFKPYPADYLMKHGYVPLNMIQTMLNNGTDPRKLFDTVGDFHEGLAVVELNGKWNWLRQDNGQLLCNQWFEYCFDFYGGLAVVKLKGMWYYMRKDGVLCDISTKEPIQQPGLNEMVKNILNKFVFEATAGAGAGSNVGAIEFDVPFPGDEETLDRTPGDTCGMHDRVGKSNVGEGKKRKKVVKNDKGEVVPEKCTVCGEKVGLYIKGCEQFT